MTKLTIIVVNGGLRVKYHSSFSTNRTFAVPPLHFFFFFFFFFGGGGGREGWSGGAKVSCSLRHRGVQLILAYNWARPVTLVAGKGRGGMFSFLLFLHFHSRSSFFPVPLFLLLYYLFYLFSPFFWKMTQNDPQGLTCR